MIKVKINGIEYEVKTEWSEVDCNELAKQHFDGEGKPRATTFKDELKCLTNIPADLIDKANDTQLFPLYTIFSFIDNMDLMPSVEALEVSRAPYDDFEVAKDFAKADVKPYRKFIEVAKVYYPDEKNPVRIIGLGVNIVNQISVFLSAYKDMWEDPPDEDSVRAGIEELGVFGIFGTGYTLAGKDLLKLEQVLKLPTIRVYTALYYNWKEAKYAKRLWDIKNPKKK